MAGRTLKVAGDILSMNELLAVYNAATGKQLEGRSLGTVQKLQADIAQKKQNASSPLDYVFYPYHYAMVSGKGKLEPLDNNRYPEIRPVGVEQFLREKGG